MVTKVPRTVTEDEGKRRAPLPLQIDYERYAGALNGADPSDPHVRELIAILFHIQWQAVEIAWGCGPVQNACGQITKACADPAYDRPSMVQSSATDLTPAFNHAGGQREEKEAP